MVVIDKTYKNVRGVFAKCTAFGMAIFSLFSIVFLSPVKETKLQGDPSVSLNIAHADISTNSGGGASGGSISDGTVHGSFSSDSDGSAGGTGDSGCDGGCDGGCE
jgi:hypothetical protein